MQSKNMISSLPFLSDSGECGEIIKSVDWSQNPLGDPANWPQSLKASVNIVLRSSYPMFIWWGPQLINIHNDAYITLMGNKHPFYMAKPAPELWAEIWEENLLPLKNKVFDKGEAVYGKDMMLLLKRKNFTEECYFNFSYSPITDDNGNVDGLFCACHEETEKVLRQRRLRTLATLNDIITIARDAYSIGAMSVDMLQENTKDILFAALYLPAANNNELHLANTMGIDNPAEVFSAVLSIGQATSADTWNIATVVTTNQPLLIHLANKKKSGLPASINGDPIQKVWIVPLHSGDHHKHGGAFVFGLSPHLEFDDEYRFYLQSVVNQVSTAINERLKQQDVFKSEETFRELVMQAPVGITIFRGPELIVEMANKNYLEVVDRKEEQLVGKKLFDALPEVEEFVAPLLLRVMETGEPYYGKEFGVTLLRKGRNESAYFNFIYQPLRDAQGKISGIIVISNEVTEEVNARHLLAESETEFRRMVTQSPIAMTIWRGKDFIIEIANEVMLKTLWRLEEKDVIGKKALEVFPELLDQKYPELLQQVLDSGKVYRENESLAYVRGKDGIKQFYLDFEYAPLFEADGTISGIMITVNDVTDKVEAKHRLEDAEERMRMAAEGTGLATWDLNLRTYDIIYSPRLLEIFGHAAGVQLTHAEMRRQIHPEDLVIVETAFALALETGIYDYQARVVRPDGTIRWARTQGRVFFDKDIPLRLLGTMRDITEQKNSQTAIEESENRLNIAIDAAELGTWELNLKTRAGSYSKRYLKILGFDEDESPSHEQVLKHIHPDDRGLREKAISDALKSGSLNMELRIIHPDYSVHWIKAMGKVFYDGKGNPERIMGTVVDVTKEEKTILNLQESEERFRTIANTAPVMIWMSGNDKFADFFNTSWLRFTGRKIEQEVGDGWLEGVHPDDIKKCTAIYQAGLLAQKGFYTEYRLLHHDGQYRWISDNAVPRYGSDGKFIGFISACMDIDAQKNSIEKVMANELLFKTITNVSPVALWMTDESGRNTFVNDTWIQWTGLSPDGRRPEGENWMHAVIEADRDFVTKKFRQVLPTLGNFSSEFRIKRKDGKVRWVLSEGTPYYAIDGSFAGYAGSVLDITERKQDEIRKNEFLAVASHELKTPLTSIKAYAQLLAKTYESGEDAFLKTALGKVGNQVNKMTKLVGDFLNLSKIESDKFQLNKETFDLQELMKDVTAEIQLVSVNHQISIDESGPVQVNADREKIAQVITNLLNNAVKYSPVNKLVHIGVKEDKEHVTLSVTDNGIGINKEEHEKIFQRFYRSEFNNNISFSGFGIGLYISAEIIRSHHGRIGVNSEGGRGATFYFTLPLSE